MRASSDCAGAEVCAEQVLPFDQSVAPVRYFVPILGLLLLLGGLGAIKFTQFSNLMDAGAAYAKAGPPPLAVSTDQSRELSWEGTLSAVGTVAAVRAVAVSNDAPGVVKQIRFESGAVAKAGQILVELDTSVEKAQIATALARKQLAEQTAERTASLYERKGVAQAQLQSDNAQLQAVTSEVDGLRAQIERKVVRAAFTGRLGIRQVNLGQYLSPGTTLTTLDALDSVFVDFSLPQQALQSLKPGLKVRVTIEGDDGAAIEGAIAAIDPSLDATTRSIRVRASVPNEQQKLRPGMFAKVSTVLPERASIVAVPQTAIVHAPYGDSLFLVEPLEEQPNAPTGNAEKTPTPVQQVRQQFVRLGEQRGDFVAVLDGVKAGQEIVTAGAFKLRNGATITIDNKLKPDPKVDPRPENR